MKQLSLFGDEVTRPAKKKPIGGSEDNYEITKI